MAIKPGKYDPLKPDIELLDYKSKKRYGLRLEGASALQVGTISQDDTVHIRAAGKRVGDFDEQRSWKGGRGVWDLSKNPEGFWDSQNVWTMSEGHAHQTLLWERAIGLRTSLFFLPNRDYSLSWYPLLGDSVYMSQSFSPGGSFNADHARLWIRKRGAPGTLTFKIHSDTAGNPDSVLQTVTLTDADVEDTVSVFQLFDWTGTQAVTATTFHITVQGASTDNKANHWEMGGTRAGASSKVSPDGSSWTSIGFTMFFVVEDADIKRTFFSFILDDAMYLVDKKDDGTASALWINGDRGKATGFNSTQIAQTGKTWSVDVWVGAWVKIVRGNGSGQTRQIVDNTADTISVFPAWDVSLSTDSEYIIYNTPYFTAIGTTGLGHVVSQPCVSNQIVYFPQGPNVNIRRMIWNPATPGHSFSDDSTNKASFMLRVADTTGIRLWVATNNTGSGGRRTLTWSAAPAWATSPTSLTYDADVKDVGDATSPITGLCEKDGTLYIFKTDGMWMASASILSGALGSLVKVQNGMEKTPSVYNGLASIAHQQFLYYSWMHSVMRVYGSSHDDIGQDWSGRGLPDGREGNFSSFEAYTSLLIAAVDAGDGTSSVLGFDGIGWHEIVRAYDAGHRIRFIKMQANEGTRNRLWTDVGGDLVFQEFPLMKSSPYLDTGVRYMHEGVLESAAIDMGTASSLPKFIKELVVYCENLGSGNEIYVDFQTDDDVHTSNWIEATALLESPESVAFLGLNNIRKFAYRLRINSSDNTLPVDVQGVIPNGYARSPYKMVWTLRCRADNITSRGRLVKPDMLMRWLLDSARAPGRIEMRSQYELAHKFFVIIHPPRMFPYKPGANGQSEESVFTLVLEEA